VVTDLVGYFKYLVWLTFGALTIVLVAGGVIFYSNMHDLRTDVIEKATQIATNESHNAVKTAFDEKNITQQIQKAAQEKIGTITDKMIEQQLTSKLQPIQKRILMIGEISESEARMRLGFRSGLEELKVLMTQTKDPETLQFARNTLTVTADDYELTWAQDSKIGGQSIFSFLQAYSSRPQTGYKPPTNLAGVTEIISRSQDLNLVAVAFLAFREMTGDKAKMFDFDAVKKWCANNEPKCK